ncbi:MAG: hypothetical protein ACFFDH_08030 [Promethearchaeota archaeon]
MVDIKPLNRNRTIDIEDSRKLVELNLERELGWNDVKKSERKRCIEQSIKKMLMDDDLRYVYRVLKKVKLKVHNLEKLDYKYDIFIFITTWYFGFSAFQFINLFQKYHDIDLFILLFFAISMTISFILAIYLYVHKGKRKRKK